MLLPLGLEYVPKELRQSVTVRLFPRIRTKILEVAGAKILPDLITGKSVWLSDKKGARVKLGRKIDHLQAIIRAVRGCAHGHHFKPDVLFYFKHIYKIDSFNQLGRKQNKDSKLMCQLSIRKKELVGYVVDITVYLVLHYGLHVLIRRLTTLHIIK